GAGNADLAMEWHAAVDEDFGHWIYGIRDWGYGIRDSKGAGWRRGSAFTNPASRIPNPGLLRRQGLQRQRVDRAAHQVAQGGVDQLVPRQRQFAGELAGDHGGLEMHAVGAFDLGPGAGQACFDHRLY